MKRGFESAHLLLASLFFCSMAAAQTTTIKAEVWDVRGPATYAVGPGAPRPIETGTIIPAGAVVKTGLGAALDISLGKKIGSIRLAQNTVLGFEKLQMTDSKGDLFDIQLSLTEGSLLGEVRDVPAAGKLDVKTPASLTGLRGGKFRIQAEGYIVLLDGHILNVYIPPTGDPVLYKLNAPPAVYFSPTEAVRPAPPALIQEVQGQLKARLRSP